MAHGIILENTVKFGSIIIAWSAALLGEGALQVHAVGAPAQPAVAAQQPGSPVRGEKVYLKSCAACHGDKGDGKSAAGVYLNPLPRDFTLGLYKFRTTEAGALPTDADLMRTINMGIPGTQMPAWGGLLTPQESADVLAYIKTFSEDFQTETPQPITIPTPPKPSSEMLREGRMIFITVGCWTCHGPAGKGNGVDGKALTDDWGNPIKPRNLTQARYRNGNDPASIYRTFSTGLNGTPMAAYLQADFLIGRDAAVDPVKLKASFKEKDVAALRQWLMSKPATSEINRYSEEQKRQIAENNKWALAYYVNSLVKQPNFFVRMFTENTEVTP